MPGAKFPQIIRLRSCLDHFDFENACEFIQELFDTGRQDIIWAGLIRQLYHLGESIDAQFLDRLATKAHDLLRSKDNRVLKVKHKASMCNAISPKKVTDLSNDALCHIGSYLSCKDILTKWNHVNRKFVEIGYKSGIIHTWEFDSKCGQQLQKNPPKFRLDSLMSTVTTLKYDCGFTNLFNVSKMKSLKNISIDAGKLLCRTVADYVRKKKTIFCVLCCNTVIVHVLCIIAVKTQLIDICNHLDKRNDKYDCQLQSVDLIHCCLIEEYNFYQWLHDKYFKLNTLHHNLKRITLNRYNFDPEDRAFTDDHFNETPDESFQEMIPNIDVFLQMLIPLSLQDLELKRRIANEIVPLPPVPKENSASPTSATLVSRKDEELRAQNIARINDIKHEVDVKYEQFYQNEVCDSDLSVKDFVHSSGVEMLSFINCRTEIGVDEGVLYVEYFKHELNEQRVKNSLRQLKAFQFTMSTSEEAYYNPFDVCVNVFKPLAGAVLNRITPQLVSLHLEDDTYVYSRGVEWGLVVSTEVASMINCNYNVNYTFDYDHDNINDSDEKIHIDGDVDRLDFESKSKQVEQMKNNYKHKGWFPAKVEEFCLSMSDDSSHNHFWICFGLINSIIFPRLKHLKIINNLDVQLVKAISDGNIFDGLLSLVLNGLESFDLRLNQCELNDLLPGLPNGFKINTRRDRVQPGRIIELLRMVFANKVCDHNNVGKSNGEPRSTGTRTRRAKDFILKLGFEFASPRILRVRSENMPRLLLNRFFEQNWFIDNVPFDTYVKSNQTEKMLSQLLSQIGLLFGDLNNMFAGGDVMVAVKLKINIDCCSPNQAQFLVDDINGQFIKLTKGTILQKYVDSGECVIQNGTKCNSTSEYDGVAKIVYQLVMKNKGCLYSYMDPKFKYPCNCCDVSQWFDYDLQQSVP